MFSHMTVAVLVKVFDGIVLATDSATTLPLANGSAQVYNNADKIFQLHRDKPIGAMTWGLGSIGSASISTLAKDLRRRLMGRDPDYLDWVLEDTYTIEGVATRLTEMFHDLFATEFQQPPPSILGMLVVGYSSGSKQSEVWLVTLEDPAVRPVPQLVAGVDQAGWQAYAQPEATLRLFEGFDPALPGIVARLHGDDERSKLQEVLSLLHREPAQPSMPFPDAIALAKFLVDVTVGYSHFLLGPDTVGGPVEVAGLSRHEGFKWISRKHYYPGALNREDHHHA